MSSARSLYVFYLCLRLVFLRYEYDYKAFFCNRPSSKMNEVASVGSYVTYFNVLDGALQIKLQVINAVLAKGKLHCYYGPYHNDQNL